MAEGIKLSSRRRVVATRNC